MRSSLHGIPVWSLAAPVLAGGVLASVWGGELSWIFVALVAAALIAAVFSAVHHAEVIALRVGEPFGTLVLALAVTVIEASLIVTLMLSGGESTSILARDYNIVIGVFTFYAALVGLANLAVDVIYPILDPRIRY